MTQNAYQGDVVVWSDDGGQTYNHSDSLHLRGMDEWQMVELANHSILGIVRNCAGASGNLHNCTMLKAGGRQGGAKRVAVALSEDGGLTFSKPWLDLPLRSNSASHSEMSQCSSSGRNCVPISSS